MKFAVFRLYSIY